MYAVRYLLPEPILRHLRPAPQRTASLAAVLFVLLAVAPPSHADLLLNEISLKGIPAVELYNSGSLPIDLTGFRLDVDGLLYPLAGIVPPGGVLVPSLTMTDSG